MEANAKVRHEINAVHSDPRTSVPQPEGGLGRQHTQHQAPQQVVVNEADGCSAPAPGPEAACAQADRGEGRMVCCTLCCLA